LAGGSRVATDALTFDGDHFVLQPRRQAKLKLDARAVASIRFRSPSAKTDAQWLGLQDPEGGKDVVVIRRQEDQLDSIAGVILKIDATTVTLDLGDDVIPAPIQRLEGVIFGSPASQTATTSTVVSTYGSIWKAVTATLDRDQQAIRLQISADTFHTLPLSRLAEIRWSSGMTMLAAQAPASSRFSPYVQTKLAPEFLNAWFAPRDPQAGSSEPSGDSGSKEDLVLHGGSSVDYRIESGFARLIGRVQRDDSVDHHGTTQVTIRLDDQEVFSESIRDDQPLGFDLPLAGASRVTLAVEAGPDGNVGDTIRFVRPRIVK
ncbi:MAG: NPCBM/NEW2 domain-containing protein, partial [Planctomycetota bacterium]